MSIEKSLRAKARALQAETGMPYTAALRAVQDEAVEEAAEAVSLPPVQQGWGPDAEVVCEQLVDRLASEFDAPGWPRAVTSVGRVALGTVASLVVSDTADVPVEGDAVVTLPGVTVVFPADGEPVGVFPGSLRADAKVARVSRLVGSARKAALAAAVDDAECGYCPDRYPAAHLLNVFKGGGVRVCPACAFEPDVVEDRSLRKIADAYEAGAGSDRAFPAAWTAVAAFVAAVRLEAGDWRVEASALRDLWVWLPSKAVRPKCWRGFGPGARLVDLVETLAAAMPTLFADVWAEWVEEWEDDDEVEPIGAVWPVVVAYAVGFTTQQLERPGNRSPWHVISDSLDASVLGDVIDDAVLDWDAEVVSDMLNISARVAAALFPSVEFDED